MNFSLVTRGTDGVERRFALDAEATLGRTADNDLALPGNLASKRHARIAIRDGVPELLDLGSRNGTRVNGRRITAATALSAGDRITIGEWELVVAADPRPPEPAEPEADRPADPSFDALRKTIHDRLIEGLDLRRLDLERLGDAGIRGRAEALLGRIVAEMDAAGEIPEGVDRSAVGDDVLHEALGLGPLDALLADDDVTEIMVNGASRIWVERAGRLSRSERTFSSDAAVLHVIERIVAPVGRRIDEASPLVDARLSDGSRVNAIIAPLSLKGPSLTIRKFRRERLRIEDLVRMGTLDPAMAAFLRTCVRARRNVVISGGTGSGKTTTLNVLASFIPADERIVSMEDAAELQLPQEHWVPLEARPPNLEGKGAVTIRDLVKNALRMRPDRIVVGECRSGEALDMLQAMNTGHDGSLTTLHANSPRDALARIETMALMSGMELPIRAIREQVASVVGILVHQARFADGSRRITHVSEVTGMEGDVISLQDLFLFRQEGQDADGKVRGRFAATGIVPRFFDDLRARGVPVDLRAFAGDEVRSAG